MGKQHEKQRRSHRSTRFHLVVSMVFAYMVVVGSLAAIYLKLQHVESLQAVEMSDSSYFPNATRSELAVEVQDFHGGSEESAETPTTQSKPSVTPMCNHGYNNNDENLNENTNNAKEGEAQGAEYALELELEREANKIIDIIKRDSRNAIIPRFNIKKRAETDQTDTTVNNGGNSFLQGETTVSSATETSLTSESSSSTLTTFPPTTSNSPTDTETTSTPSTSSTSSTSSSSSSSTSSTTEDVTPSQASFTPTPSTTLPTTSASSVSQIIPSSNPVTSSTSSLVIPSSVFVPTPSTTSSTSISTFSEPSPTSSSSSSSTSSTTLISTSSSSSTSTTSLFSSDFGSYTVIGQTTLFHSEVSTIYRTMTASASPVKSKGISAHDKNIAIGVSVGLGVPILGALAALALIYRRRNQKSSVQNYVDSNGRETGIAVEEGNKFTRAPRRAFGSTTLMTHQSKGDFDDEDFDEEPNTGAHAAGGPPPSGETGFVVNRPRPLRVLNEDTSPEEANSAKSSHDSHPEHF